MTDKPNYNDGNWHGWNGGECPVHPETEVEAVFSNSFGEMLRDTRLASSHMWNSSNMPKAATFAFRVVKEHREPREFWLGCAGGYRHTYDTLGEAQTYKAQNKGAEIIHVREVLP